MAAVAAGGGDRARAAEQARLPWREQEPRSPDIAAPPRPTPRRSRPARAAVVYYLSRNGHLEHPHFMEVALSSPDGLYLRGTNDALPAHASFSWCFAFRFHGVERVLCCVAVAAVRADVIDRLDALRGKGMARMYSWASKR
jgi:hypothetical protein